MKCIVRVATLAILMVPTAIAVFAHPESGFGPEQSCVVTLGSAEFKGQCSFYKTDPYVVFNITVVDHIAGGPKGFSGAVDLSNAHGNIATSEGMILGDGDVSTLANGIAPSGFGAGAIIRWSGNETTIIRVLEDATVQANISH